VISVIKLDAAITSQFPAETAVMSVSLLGCFLGALLDSCWENRIVFGGDSCSFDGETGSDNYV
jgi:hypothetical protein